MHPDHAGLANAVVTLLGPHMAGLSFLLVERGTANDGFLEVFRMEQYKNKWVNRYIKLSLFVRVFKYEFCHTTVYIKYYLCYIIL